MIYTYAKIEEGIVKNVALASSNNDIFADDPNYVRIDNLDPMPQIFWKYDGAVFSPPDAPPVYDQIFSRIQKYQQTIPALLTDIYTQNTINGITLLQSDQLFDDYEDVIIRLSQGAFPTALYRLSQKTPSGFVTQDMIDGWVQIIKSHM